MKRRDFLLSSVGVAGVVLPTLGRGQNRPCPPPSVNVSGGTSATTPCGSASAEADWLARSTGQGVVWAHDFRNQAEVDLFRWTGGYAGGNDPLGKGSGAMKCFRQTADGVTGGACLEQIRPAGANEASGAWWRPFSAVNNNGRGFPDPAANGTVPVHNWNPTDGGNQTNSWGTRGVYGHPSYAGPGFDGTEFYLQMRVKMDPRRLSAGMPQVGKLTFLSHTAASLTAQELVTYSGALFTGKNFFRVYGPGFTPLEVLDTLGRPGQQVGNDLGFCDVTASPGNCWAWSGGWDTVMYHITPGRQGVAETHFVVFAAHEGETVYRKIWDQLYATNYDFDKGWNALITSSFQNGFPCPSEFWHRYDQIILSRQLIPCPLV